MQTIDAFLSYAGLALPPLYFAISFAQKNFGKYHRWAARNARAYMLVFDYSLLTFFAAGILGMLLLYYPQVEKSLEGADLDGVTRALLPSARAANQGQEPGQPDGAGEGAEKGPPRSKFQKFLKDWHIGGDKKNLERLLGFLRVLAFWFLTLGVCTAALGRREVFFDVCKAVAYHVQERRSMYAVTYTAVGAMQMRETCVSKYGDAIDTGEWERTARRLHEALLALDGAFRKSRQGGNVRVVLEVGELRLHYWRLGTHAYVVARPRDRTDLTGHPLALLWRLLVRRSGDKEFRALVCSIRAIASIHGG